MGTRFYVAGAWTEQHRRARPMIARLETAGLVCTCNWTQAEGDVCMCGHHRQQHAPMADIVGATAKEAWRAEGSTRCEVMLLTGHVGDVERCWCTYFNGIGSGGDSQLTVENRIKFARADLEGVLAADVVWLLAANDKGACGSWVELGAALAAVELRRAQLGSFGGVQGIAPVIVVSGPKCRRTVFTEIAQHLVEDDDEALKLIVKMHEERSGVRAALGT